MKLLKSQADDLDTLLSHCTAQLEQMTGAYKEELAAIEDVLMQVTGKGGC